MGLKKSIELDNGVIVNYHRIVSINKVTNVSNIIEIASYTNEEKREEFCERLQENVNVEEINREVLEQQIVQDRQNDVENIR